MNSRQFHKEEQCENKKFKKERSPCNTLQRNHLNKNFSAYLHVRLSLFSILYLPLFPVIFTGRHKFSILYLPLSLLYLFPQPISISVVHLFFWRCPWCNGYRRRKWTRRHEFKYLDEADCILHSTNTLGKGMNPIILPPAMGK